MKVKLIVLVSLLISLWTGSVLAAKETIITGAGATFPYPIYVKWAEAYRNINDVALNYQPIGSGGGIKQVQANTVEFGASDKPLSNEELAQYHLIQFPTVIGGVVPVINITGIKNDQIKLSGTILANIYLGNIKKWNDAKIVALNPEIKLPEQNITVVHRSDGSGTTFLFTHYLAKVNPAWRKRVGSDTAVSWPAGIGGKGNEGVASYVQRIPGSIGYVEYAYAKQNKLANVQLQNSAGNIVTASITSFQAAAANADWNSKTNFAEILTDQPGTDSWPISGASFILLNNTPTDSEKAKVVLNFFAWAYHNGQQMATDLDYVPLPDNVVTSVENYWKTQVKNSSGQPIWQ